MAFVRLYICTRLALQPCKLTLASLTTVAQYSLSRAHVNQIRVLVSLASNFPIIIQASFFLVGRGLEGGGLLSSIICTG